MDVSLPNFLIVGAQKAGTTSLYYYLKQHPDVFMSAVKEPQFFASGAVTENVYGPGDESAAVIRDVAAYRALFTNASHARARGEASTIYLYDEEAPSRIRAELPEVKLVAVLRDPVERAYSNFLHLVRDGREPLSEFAEALKREPERRTQRWSANWRYRDKGLYACQVERYLQLFDREQIRFYLFEEFDDDPGAIVKDIYRFLGVDSNFTQNLSLRLNVAGVPRSRGLQAIVRRQDRLKWLVDPLVPDRLRSRLLRVQNSNLSRPALAPEVRASLLDGYWEDIARVGELTGLDVSRWTSPRAQPADGSA